MALIRCNKCGNLASSRAKACPICGEPIAAEVAGTAAESAPQPKTLNDILAEQQRNQTLNDRLSGDTASEPTAAEQDSNPEHTAANFEQRIAERMNEEPAREYNPQIDDYEAELVARERSIKGFRTALIVAIILLIPSLYFTVTWGLKAKSIAEDYAIVESARMLFEEQNAMLQHDAENLVTELQQLKDKNDTMMMKYQEAVVMLEQLQKEKTYNYEQLARYKKEVNTLRGVMKGYLRQIDSLNTINNSLQAQNVAYKKEINTAKMRADVAEERADELGTKVRIGAVIRTSAIRTVALNDRNKEVKRIKQATRLRVDFELTANELAEPGEKSIYICITGPDGYVLSPADLILFQFEGEEMAASAMRKVDYANESVPVSIFYDGMAFVRGTYKVDIYIDGRHSGSQETYFE
ncbi:MAG: hypothetical protein J6R81_00260 [Alistipes sp.]|nr:hypothetical protein [Alistipes sp.]